MRSTDNSDARLSEPVSEGGVLAALPRTRPQRASARRAAARGRTSESETLASAGKRDAGASTESGRDARESSSSAKSPSSRSSSPKKASAGRSVGKRGESARGKKKTETPARKKKTATLAHTTRARVEHDDAKRNPKRKPQPPKPAEQRVPKQGYEPEEELELGHTVNPPSGVELVESLTDIVSELAGSSLTAGGRLLRDALSLLRRP